MWNKLRLSAVLCLLLGWQVPADAGEPKTADEVIARYIEGIGGRKKLDSIKTKRMTGKSVVGGGMEIGMTMEAKRPNKTRVEIKFQGMTGVRAYDGEIGWSIMPFMGKTDPERMPPDELEMFKEEADFDGVLIDYKKKGHQIELVGKEEIEGTDAYKLKVTTKGGDVDYYYLDAEYFLLIKVKGKRNFRGMEIDYETDFGDYKEVDGLLIAHSIEQKGFMGGATITFVKVEFNIEIPDDRFAMPESGKDTKEDKQKVTPQQKEDKPPQQKDKEAAEEKD